MKTPLYAMGVAAGDVVSISDLEAGAFVVISRGGKVSVHFYLGEKEQDDIAATQVAASRILSEFGTSVASVDGLTAGLVVYTIPCNVGFARIEGVFQAAERLFPGSQWQYGNVFDPVTGEPLRWWE